MSTYIYTEFIGKTATDIIKSDDELVFKFSDDTQLTMFHEQDCCETVYIEDIIGDISDLVGTPITMFEEVTEFGRPTEWGETSTWTFYKIATVKGYVTIRWFGTNNGYYSEEVNLEYSDSEGVINFDF